MYMYIYGKRWKFRESFGDELQFFSLFSILIHHEIIDIFCIYSR